LRANADIRLFSRFLDKFDVVSNQPLCSGIFKDFNRNKGEPACCFMPRDFPQGPAIPHHYRRLSFIVLCLEKKYSKRD